MIHEIIHRMEILVKQESGKKWRPSMAIMVGVKQSSWQKALCITGAEEQRYLGYKVCKSESGIFLQKKHENSASAPTTRHFARTEEQ